MYRSNPNFSRYKFIRSQSPHSSVSYITRQSDGTVIFSDPPSTISISRDVKPPPLTLLPKDSPEYLLKLCKNLFYPNEKSDKDYKDLLPALTSSNSIDLELYCLIGLFLRQFVTSWYSRITDDEIFMDELINVIAHITRGLEERIRKVDKKKLLLDEIPLILDIYFTDFKTMKERHDTSILPQESLKESFHSLHPNFSLSSKENHIKYLQILTKGIVSLLLPPESYHCKNVRFLVESILSNIVLKNMIEKISEPYMLYGSIVKVIEIIKSKQTNDDSKINDELQQQSFFYKIYKPVSSVISTSIRMITFIASFSDNSFLNQVEVKTTTESTSQLDLKDIKIKKKKDFNPIIPYTTYSIFQFLNNLLHLNNSKPIITGFLKSIYKMISNQYISRIIDRMLNHLFNKILTSYLITIILKSLRNNLFPNDYLMGPSPIIPTPEELKMIKKNCKNEILNLLNNDNNKKISDFLTGGESEFIIDEILDSFNDKEINKYLIMDLLDMIIKEVFKELEDYTPVELEQIYS